MMRSLFRLFALSLLVALAAIALSMALRGLLGLERYLGESLSLMWGAVAAIALSIATIWLFRWQEDKRAGLLLSGLSLGLFMALALVCDFEVAVVLVIAAVFVGVALVVLYLLWRLASAFVRKRDTELQVVGHLASVVRQNLPLPAGLALAARSEKGWARIHLTRISGLLTSGVSLAEALQRGYPDCPSMVKSLVTAGERTGQLAAALHEAEAHLTERARRRERPDLPFWPYALTLFGSTLLLGLMFMTFVLPKHIEILRDYNITAPASTRIFAAIGGFLHDYGWSGTPLLLLIPLGLYLLVRPRRYPDLTWTSRVADWFRWWLPGLRRIERMRGTAAMFRTMRLAVRSGLGLETAARVAADIDVNRRLRVRMAQFADLVGDGLNSSDAAREAGLGSVAGLALASGQRSGDLQGALRYAAEYHDAVISRWLIVLANLVWPMGTVILATLVSGIILAMFQPIVAMLEGTFASMGVLQ